MGLKDWASPSITGAGVLTYPHITNFDLTMTKNFPLGTDTRRVLRFQVQAYNAFNHPEFNSMNTGITFNPTTNAVSNATAVGLPTGTLPARVMASSDYSSELRPGIASGPPPAHPR